jgi:hypothetical protein
VFLVWVVPPYLQCGTTNKLKNSTTNKMTTEEKNNLVIKMKQESMTIRAELHKNFPSIYSIEDVQKVLFDYMLVVTEMVQAVETNEETPTEEQTFTLRDINNALLSLDFDYSDFASLDVNDYGNECKIEAVINVHELSDYVKNEIIEFLNNIEK